MSSRFKATIEDLVDSLDQALKHDVIYELAEYFDSRIPLRTLLKRLR